MAKAFWHRIMGKKDRLKNGLDALFEDNFQENAEKTEKNNEAVKMVRVSLLEPNKNQPRREFDQAKLLELSTNIATHGVLQPILVRPLENGSYQIVAGERRWRAARLADVKEVPVYIRDLSDVEVAQMALVENLQRENLNPIEEAEAYNRLATEFDMTHEAISATVGKSRSQITNSLRLLKLTDYAKKMLAEGQLSTGHGKVLAGVSDKENVDFFAESAVKTAMSVREFEKYVAEFSGKKPDKKVEKKPKNKVEKPYLVEAMLAIEQEFGRKAMVVEEKNGEITMKITFNDIDDLKNHLAKFKG